MVRSCLSSPDLKTTRFLSTTPRFPKRVPWGEGSGGRSEKRAQKRGRERGRLGNREHPQSAGVRAGLRAPGTPLPGPENHLVSPPAGGRCGLPGPQRYRSARKTPEFRPGRGTRRTPAGSALQSRSPRGRRRQQPLPPPRPNHPSGTRAAASQHVGRGRRCTRASCLGTNVGEGEGKRSCGRGRRGPLARAGRRSRSGANGGLAPAGEGGLLEAAPDALCAAGSRSPQIPPSLLDRLPGVPAALPPCGGDSPIRAAGGFRPSQHARCDRVFHTS